MVECTALEMRHRCKPIGGSNPSLSAKAMFHGVPSNPNFRHKAYYYHIHAEKLAFQPVPSDLVKSHAEVYVIVYVAGVPVHGAGIRKTDGQEGRAFISAGHAR